jgi:hypothetical protein
MHTHQITATGGLVLALIVITIVRSSMSAEYVGRGSRH